MKPPKLRPNESTKSFKARVAKWEKATGKKYPRSFSEQSNEERALKGNIRIGLDKKKDYSSNYDDELKESQTNKARTTKSKEVKKQKSSYRNTTTQDVKDKTKESSLESLGKTDFSKVKLPPSEKVKIKKSKEQNNQSVKNEKSPKPAEKVKIKPTTKGTGPVKDADKYSSHVTSVEEKAWLKKTKNSPAGKAFGDSPSANKLRLKARRQYLDFKKRNNRK